MSATCERSLGLLERYSVARHNADLFYSLVVGARYTWSGALDPRQAFEAAVARCIAEHPFLRATLVAGATNSPAWRLLGEVDVRRVIEWYPETAVLRDVLSGLHSKRFETEDSTRPLWRLVLLPQEASVMALFSIHHALCDGIGALAFHKSLYRALNSRDVLKPDWETLPPPLESICETRPSVQRLFQAVLTALILPTWLVIALGLQVSCFTGSTKRPLPSSCQTSVDLVWLDDALLESLRTLCRTQNIALTALLYAALASSVCRALVGEPSRISGRIACSLRSICSPSMSDEVVGNYNSGIDQVLPPAFAPGTSVEHSREALFTLSREVTGRLREPFTRRASAREIGLLRHIPYHEPTSESTLPYDTGWERFFRRQAEQRMRNGTIGISNLGEWTPRSHGGAWAVGDLTFSQSVGALAALICLSTITTGGAMCAAFTWQQGSIEVPEAQKIQTTFLEILRDLVQVDAMPRVT